MFLLELDNPVLDFATVHVELTASVSSAVLNMVSLIDPDDVGPKGLELDPHITILYGLHDPDPEAVRRCLMGETIVSATLKSTSLFHTKDGDVLKIDVESPDLHRLRNKLLALPHTLTYKDYMPHVTLGYLRAGHGDKYVNNGELNGLTVQFDTAVYSTTKKERTRIKLGQFVMDLPQPSTLIDLVMAGEDPAAIYGMMV